MTERLTRDSPFSYTCNGCGACCRHKRIQVGPYEVLRLARGLGLGTGEFLARHLDHDGPYLRVDEAGYCEFLRDGACSVHADRPLACRTYPLGRFVSGSGEETFGHLAPHPESAGEYGLEGTVADFLSGQGAWPYIAAADRLQALFYRLFDALQARLARTPELAGDAEATLARRADDGLPAVAEWLDVDAWVTRYGTVAGRQTPADPQQALDIYLDALTRWAAETQGEPDEQQ